MKDNVFPSLALTAEKNNVTIPLALALIALTVLTSLASRFDAFALLEAIPGVAIFIATDFFPPDIAALPNISVPFLETCAMAVVSTVAGAAVSLFLALMCASPTRPYAWTQVPVRALVSLLRNIPSVAWALILVPAFGIGKFVGLLALLIGSIGSMTRFFTESIEEINLEGIEAVRSTGASYWQTVKSAVLPQCLPSVISWTLYNLELNIRASAIIGMVGGGGIGMYIQSAVKLFRYDRAAMAILLVAAAVIGLEYVSNKTRERIK